MKFIVVGSGWAGLAASLQVSKLGHEVILVESAPQAGGRARGVKFGEDILDNGQHLLMGAYQNLLKVLEWLHIPEKNVFDRVPFWIPLLELPPSNLSHPKDYKEIEIKFANLPKPFHLLSSLILSKGFSIKEFYSIFKLIRFIRKSNLEVDQDVSVLQFLKNLNQSQTLIKKFWEPIALAALTTPIKIASARIFINVLQQVFNGSNDYSDLLFPTTDLSRIFPEPVTEYLKREGHTILFNTRATELEIEGNRALGIRTNSPKQETLRADGVILATSPKATLKLLEPYPLLTELQQNLAQFSYQPITTLYFKYSTPTQFNLPLKLPMLGLLNSTAQWVFKRGCVDPNNTILSVVISGLDADFHHSQNLYHLQNVQNENDLPDKEKMVEHIKRDLKKCIPELGDPVSYKIITEKQAAFSCIQGIDKIRPPTNTEVKNLFLAGDYTQTELPATLEGAILSGLTAAGKLCNNF